MGKLTQVDLNISTAVDADGKGGVRLQDTKVYELGVPAILNGCLRAATFPGLGKTGGGEQIPRNSAFRHSLLSCTLLNSRNICIYIYTAANKNIRTKKHTRPT